MTTAYIGLGSNLGDREGSIRTALKMLAEAEGVDAARVSEIVETEPLGQADQPRYLNAVAELKTTLTAENLYKKLADIETAIGRVRREKWAPRTIDLDLLVFGEQIISQADLVIPHPQMHLRSFVLKGLSQLNPDLLHPIMSVSVRELAARLNGSDFVLNPDVPQLVSIAGIIGVGKTTLAKRLSNSVGCKLLLEPYDTNPFMPEVYAGRKELALDSQLYFLTSRAAQLDRQTLVPGRIVVTDYVFNKEHIYARRLLDPRQLSLYEELYRRLSREIVTPVLAIYLQDSVQRCLQHIHKRNRPYEQRIEPRFLEALHCDYEQLFATWKTCPVIRLSMSQFDCTQDGDIEHLTNQMRCYVAV